MGRVELSENEHRHKQNYAIFVFKCSFSVLWEREELALYSHAHRQLVLCWMLWCGNYAQDIRVLCQTNFYRIVFNSPNKQIYVNSNYRYQLANKLYTVFGTDARCAEVREWGELTTGECAGGGGERTGSGVSTVELREYVCEDGCLVSECLMPEAESMCDRMHTLTHTHKHTDTYRKDIDTEHTIKEKSLNQSMNPVKTTTSPWNKHRM